MPTNQLAPPDMPWLTGNVASPPNPLGPPLLNYAAPPPDASTSQGAAVADTGQAAWQWFQDQRAESVRQGLLDPNTGLPTQAGVVDAARQTAQGVMMGTTAPGDVPPPGIVAYHGSPHSFDQFDTSKIGTGEGAQAYGHGLYFAGNEGVAQAYRKNLSGPAPSFTGEIAPEFLEALKADDNLGFDNASQAIAAIRSHPDWPQRWDPTDPQKLQALFEAHEQSKYGGQGSMYQVNIGADPEQFLDWDKPRDALSTNVQAWAKENYPGAWDKAADGSSLYNLIVKQTQSEYPGATKGYMPPPGFNAHAQVTQEMANAGIPGIRYLDQGSRGARDPIKLVGNQPYDPSDPTHIASHAMDMASGDRTAAAAIADRHAQLRAAEGDTAGADAMRQASTLLQSPRTIPPMTEGQPPGTHNYVVFDASTIDILRKYGIAGLIAGGGAAAAGTQQQQPQPTPGS